MLEHLLSPGFIHVQELVEAVNAQLAVLYERRRFIDGQGETSQTLHDA
jgi:hypothetical protein